MMDYDEIAKGARKRLADIEDERRHLLALIEHAEALCGVGAVSPVVATQNIGVRSRVRRPAPAMGPTRDAARTILEEYGEPLETRDLLPLVRERGVEVGGKDPIATLSARLSNSDEFRNKRGVGWWFADRAYPGEIEFEEAETGAVEGHASASSEDDSNGGISNAAALASAPFE